MLASCASLPGTDMACCNRLLDVLLLGSWCLGEAIGYLTAGRGGLVDHWARPCRRAHSVRISIDAARVAGRIAVDSGRFTRELLAELVPLAVSRGGHEIRLWIVPHWITSQKRRAIKG